MKVLLVDDEELGLLRLEKECKKALNDALFLTYTNPLRAYEENKDNDIDLAFLDIEMPMINGIQLAKKLKSKNPNIKIIFVTAFDNYALEAYKVHASGYITKPVNKERLMKNYVN